MSWFPRPSSPSAAIRDLAAFLRHSSREQRIAGALAFLITTIIVIVFLVDAQVGTAPPPQVVYVDLYAANRTDADIIAEQKKEMAIKSAGEKERRREYQHLENELGM